MANRTISLITYATDGTVNTTVTPTVTVSYGGAAASALTPTANGNYWNVTIDDTQDATLLVSGTGLVSDHLVFPRIPADRLAEPSDIPTADITAIKAKTDNLPTDPADQSLLTASIAALNDLSTADVVTALGTYDASTAADLAPLATQANLAALNDISSAEVTAAVEAATITATVDEQSIASAVWANATRTLTGFGTLVADVWAHATRSLTDKSGFSGTATNMRGTDNALLAASYVAPDNAGIDAIETAISLIRKHATNKMTKVDNNNGTMTVTIYDDDGVTPVLTYLYTAATDTRDKAV